ncbi:helix-turn-helix transcriptional regulator [Fervidibacter sacchari]|uniref:DNA-binding CsgD family transcriptional regulator n=1 Tax=Candidatus Fervidibacter sacchari TaxID=1448929 RepID=A0ABT2EWD3_9BACT|nr:helix-turn-helix transcriptional regulator [Candidatus Fervidibacter sacchari]MCS3921220.1 DNA-binding CsgD family transcriptional regulator [Candidatus Fervidibacter sacchari]WKU16480.1 helix-turn-helix transcriptional regulator [Candidatus Fervidibacter sacchari]
MKPLKVVVLTKTEKDEDYLRLLLSQGKGVSLCDSPFEADATVMDANILTPAEISVLKALLRYGNVKQAASQTHYAITTFKKHLNSARRKLKVNTNLQALVIACLCRLIPLQDILPSITTLSNRTGKAFTERKPER